MDKKKSFGQGLEAFFAGKGFYIVLFLCVAVIGASAWVMLTENGTDVENTEIGMSLENEPLEPTAPPAPVTTPAPTPAPVMEPEPDAAQEVLAPADEPAGEAEPVIAPEEPKIVNSFFVWPVTGEIESPYSMAALIYSRTMRDWRTHDGVDIACELGTEVKAASGGTVTGVESDDMYGMTVSIDHGNGLCSTYSNLAEVPTVKVGDIVTPGQVIGSVGGTALCETGEVTHLHFAMAQNGESVDPADYMP